MKSLPFHRMLLGGMALLLSLSITGTQLHAQTSAPDSPDVTDQVVAMHEQTRGDVADAPASMSHYRIVGEIDPVDRTWVAEQTLTYTNTSSDVLTTVPLRLFANLSDFGGQTTLSDVQVNGQTVDVTYRRNNYIAELALPTPLEPGARVSITCKFSTAVPWGVGRSLYGAFNHDGKSMAMASAYPMVAEYGPRGWDTAIPDTKGDLVNSPMAWYDVTVSVPHPYQLASTGTVLRSERQRNSTTYHIVSGIQRDFMVVVSKLGMVSELVDGTLISMYYPTGQYKDGLRALKYARQALQLYNRLFGQYPYNELDIVAVDAASFYGVEYPGLLLMQDRLYTSAWFLESIIAHEVAHQWFYNVVGNDVQIHPWVDESMASYAQLLYREFVWAPSASYVEKLQFERQYARLQTRNADGAIDRPMWEFSLYTYNVIAYAKGALYIDALRKTAGDEAFLAALRDYYTANRYQTVDGTALRDAVAQRCNCDVQSVYARWVSP
jgi:hypothetical protein